jgi:hypothetical protein
VASGGDVKDTARYGLMAIPKIAAAPKIDGTVDKREWYGASLFPRLIGAADGAVAARRTRVYAAYDDANLYIGFQIDRPPNSLAPAEADTVALLLDPAHEHKAAAAFVGNVTGAVSGKDRKFAAHVTDFGWEGEMAIPFASLSRGAPREGEVWGFDFANRQQTPVADVSALSYSTKPDDVRNFNHVVFTAAGPVVRLREAGAFFTEVGGGASVELVNFGDKPVDATVSLELLRRKPGQEGGPSTYLKGIAQATAAEGSDIVLPGSDLADMEKEHAARYAPSTQPSAKSEQSVSIPATARTEFRVTQVEPGDYLCRYQIKTAGSQTLASGVLPFTLSAPLAVTVRPFFLSPRCCMSRRICAACPSGRRARS